MQKLKLLVFIFTLLASNLVNALENLSINIDQIKKKDWQLNGLSLSLTDLQNSSQQLAIHINHLVLPEPFSDIKIFDIQCKQFSWEDNQILCKTGQAKLKSEIIDQNPFDFSFSLSEQKSSFTIKNLHLAKGVFFATAQENMGSWNVSISIKNLSLRELYKYTSKQKGGLDEVTSGSINAEIKAKGNLTGLNSLIINSLFNEISLQAKQGTIATDALTVEWELQAKQKKGLWQWQNKHFIKQGELYLEPVYLKVKEKGLQLKTQGLWSEGKGAQLIQAQFIEPDVIELNATGKIAFQAALNVEQVHISSKISNIASFTTQYISPFTQQTAFEGFNLQGKLNFELDFDASKLTQLSAELINLSVSDDKHRFAITNAQGYVNWSIYPNANKASEINWEQIKVRAIPIEAGQLRFLYKHQQISLLEPSRISMLGGYLDINKFNWLNTKGGEPKVYFEGGVKQLSLEKLSYALDWTPLVGNISGYVPGVNYHNKTLTVDGELVVQLFDGTIKINHLSSSGLFSDFSKFSMDMKIENLDLYQVTQKFEMGGMEGRVSGFMTNLYLENWQPITFYAWLGTPENDNSRHTISQKAVENIASIGGGGAADVISKGFLRFFDTFSYDRLGFGCYLHQGVCQLMGVEAAEQGYYIIKGGGIPRIDIVGYNPQVDWNVLMERLSRISSTEEVIVK